MRLLQQLFGRCGVLFALLLAVVTNAEPLVPGCTTRVQLAPEGVTFTGNVPTGGRGFAIDPAAALTDADARTLVHWTGADVPDATDNTSFVRIDFDIGSFVSLCGLSYVTDQGPAAPAGGEIFIGATHSVKTISGAKDGVCDDIRQFPTMLDVEPASGSQCNAERDPTGCTWFYVSRYTSCNIFCQANGLECIAAHDVERNDGGNCTVVSASDCDEDGEAGWHHTCTCGTVTEPTYWLSHDELSWQDARTACNLLGRDLVTITSQEQNDEIKELGLTTQTYIGLNDIDVEGDFRWVSDNSSANGTYTNWRPGEPNNWGPAGTEQCAVMVDNSSGTWNDENCDSDRPYICGPVLDPIAASRDRLNTFDINGVTTDTIGIVLESDANGAQTDMVLRDVYIYTVTPEPTPSPTVDPVLLDCSTRIELNSDDLRFLPEAPDSGTTGDLVDGDAATYAAWFGTEEGSTFPRGNDSSSSVWIDIRLPDEDTYVCGIGYTTSAGFNSVGYGSIHVSHDAWEDGEADVVKLRDFSGEKGICSFTDFPGVATDDFDICTNRDASGCTAYFTGDFEQNCDDFCGSNGLLCVAAYNPRHHGCALPEDVNCTGWGRTCGEAAEIGCGDVREGQYNRMCSCTPIPGGEGASPEHWNLFELDTTGSILRLEIESAYNDEQTLMHLNDISVYTGSARTPTLPTCADISDFTMVTDSEQCGGPDAASCGGGCSWMLESSSATCDDFCAANGLQCASAYSGARNVLEGQPCTGPTECNVITDGVFVPENTLWNIDSVFWNGNLSPNVYSINMDHNETIRSFRLQYDCQDTYHVTFRLGEEEVSSNAVEGRVSYCDGSHLEHEIVLDEEVTFDNVRISCTGGDLMCSVFEIKAYAADTGAASGCADKSDVIPCDATSLESFVCDCQDTRPRHNTLAMYDGDGSLDQTCGARTESLGGALCCSLDVASACESVCPDDEVSPTNTFEEAQAACALINMRLCHLEELEADATCFDDSACNGTIEWVWTLDQCDGDGLCPTPTPTDAPTPEPTDAPTLEPTDAPSPMPTLSPTAEPTPLPTGAPTPMPTSTPTSMPTPEPFVPPVFEVSSAHFSPFGDSVAIAMSVDTNGAERYSFAEATQNCEDLFSVDTTALFGASPKCHFASTRTLVVTLSSGATLLPADLDALGTMSTISLRSDTALERTDIPSEYASFFDLVFPGGSTSVQMPPNPVAPTARIAATLGSRVSPCVASAVELSAATSSGFGGRTATFRWSVDNCASVAVQAETASHTQVVSMSDVPGQVRCTFRLTVENFLGQQSEAVTLGVERLELNEPAVSIITDEIGNWRRHELHDLFASIVFPDCADAPDSASTSLELTWRVAGDTPNSEVVPAGGSSGTSLTLRSYELQSDVQYTFILNIHDTTNSFEDFSVSYTVHVAQAPITTSIGHISDDASVTVLSESGVTEQYVGSALQLTGGLSVDLDVPPEERAGGTVDGEFEGWSFAWSCQYIALDGVGVSEFLASAVAESSWTSCTSELLDVGEKTSISADFEANSLADDTLYRISLNAGIGSRADSAQVLVVARANPVLQVSLAGPSTVTEFQVLRIEGAIAGDHSSPLAFEWRELSHDLLEQPATADLLRTSLDDRNLVISAGALRAGLSYTFSLSVVDADGSTGEAVFVVAVSTGPIISDFTVTLIDHEQFEDTTGKDQAEDTTDLLQAVGIGVGLQSVYRLAVDAHFEGSTESLTYRFSYVALSAVDADGGVGIGESSEQFVLTRGQIAPTADVRLPSGDVRLIATVTASGGAKTEATYDVRVAESVCSSLADGMEILDELLRLGKLSESLQILQIVGSLLSRPDFVRTCVATGIDALRDDLFDMTQQLWALRSFHALEEVQQLSQVVEALSRDTARFSLTQVEHALDFVDVIFSAIDSILAENTGDSLQSTSVLFALSMSRILSHSLVADGVVNTEDVDSQETRRLFCETVERIRDLTSRLLQNEVTPLLVGEAATSISSDNIVAQAVRAAAGEEPASATTGDSTVSLQVSPTGDGDETEYSVSVSSYDDVVNQCFPTKGEQTLVSPVVDIDILECESNPAEACDFSLNYVTFQIEYSGAGQVDSCDGESRRLEELVCSFWDEELLDWSDEGCELVEVNEDDNTVTCSCTHLTAFGIIRSVRTQADSGCSASAAGVPTLFGTDEKPIGVIWIVLFGVVAAVSMVQVLRLTYYDKLVPFRRTLLTHALVSISAVAQLVAIFFYTWMRSAIGVEISSAVQLAVHYIIIALVCQQWAKTYHGVLARPNKCRDAMLNYSFYVGAVVVSLVLIAMVGVVAAADVNSELFKTGIFAGSLVTAVVGIASALIFLVYGYLLIRMIVGSAQVAGGSSRGKNHYRSAQRIFGYAVLLVMSFIAESGLVMLAALKADLFESNFIFFQSLYLAFNLLSLATVIWLMWQLVAKAERDYTARKTALTSTGSRTAEDDSRTARYSDRWGHSRGGGSQNLDREHSTTFTQHSAFSSPNARSTGGDRHSVLYGTVPSGGESVDMDTTLSRAPTLTYSHQGAPPPLHAAPAPSRPSTMSRVPLTSSTATSRPMPQRSHSVVRTPFAESVRSSSPRISSPPASTRSKSAFSGHIAAFTIPTDMVPTLPPHDPPHLAASEMAPLPHRREIEREVADVPFYDDAADDETVVSRQTTGLNFFNVEAHGV